MRSCMSCTTAWRSSISCRADDILFVYGSLRRGGRPNPVRRRLHRRARCLGDARLQGRLYRRGPYPAAVPALDSADQIAGELWQIRDPALWRVLDRYEDCAADSVRPHPYQRERVAVQSEQGGAVLAWVYWYTRPVRGLRRLANGDFLSLG